MSLTDLVGEGAVEGVHGRWVDEPPAAQTHRREDADTQTHKQTWRLMLEVNPAHSLGPGDRLPEPSQVGLADELERLHHVAVIVLLAEL